MAGTIDQRLALVSRLGDQNDFSVTSLVRERVLDYFFRCESLVNNNGKVIDLDHLLVENVAKETQTPGDLVIKVLVDFLTRVTYFKQLLESGLIAWAPGKQQLLRKVRVYLHKAHKVAPVFDYQRAKRNLELLHVLLGRKFYWPHVPTQLALIIFVTDRNDPNLSDNDYILQKNLRALCSCSAYSFHMARNKLGINKEGVLGFTRNGQKIQ